ncbi:Chalcone--flavonone isomerase 1B-1 [Mucuna pruriens]|uniref:Chalcone-flavonone isomerase family protein n=1 Tax=Mucuna pruriens TaxID=157652 RepID=A0A371II73_MUCPR|nr:Chalcone--flavonone isomerase 1B-1 [Mucuna pruriens]
MAAAATISGVQVEFLEFPALVTSSASGKTYFLGGAGERGLMIEERFIKFTGIGVYLEDKAVESLAAKWKGKAEHYLLDTLDFYRDIISGPFEKLIRGSKILPLNGAEYSKKVIENCVAHMKCVGTYGDAEAAAIEKFGQAFKDVNFLPGASVFYRQSPDGILGLSFSQDATLPANEAAVIENKAVSEAVLETMIGENAVSPDLKRSLASRLPALNMATAASITKVNVEFLEFPAVVTLPGSTKSYFLGGAGARGVTIEGKFVKVTAIGVYLEDKAVSLLAAKWKGTSSAELLDSLDFYRDIIKGPFEKLIRGSKLITLDGREYVRKVSENCVAHMKSVGTYNDAEEKAIEEFRFAFKDQNFPPGSSVFYRQSPTGTLGLSFSKDETVAEEEYAVIENKALSEAVLETMIGQIPVSPALKESLALRFHQFLNAY